MNSPTTPTHDDQFRLLVQGTADYAIFLLDPDGRVATWNDGAERLKGYAAEDIVGRHFSAFYPPEARDRGWPDEELRRAAADGRVEDEGWRVRKDGTRFWANVVITALRDEAGALRGFGKVTRDLTERRDREEALRRSNDDLERRVAERTAELAAANAALRESEGRFRAMADSAPVLIWMNGPSGAEYVNREYLAFLGRTWDEVQQMEWASGLHPDDAGGYVRAYQQAFDRRERFDAQFRFRRHDGEYRWLQSAGVPRFGPDGSFLGYVGCSFDVTDTKRAEEVLRAEGRRKDEFLATLAHELRNPLAPIWNAVAVLKRGVAPDAAGRLLGMMERQLGQLTHLVDDLLDVSRVSRGKVTLRPERLDLREVVGAAVETSRPAVEAHRHTLAVSLPETSVWVAGDRTRLTQVLTNLLTNAAKYTPAGGRIGLTAGAEGADAVVRVSDTGVGIPADMLPRVFDLFTQVDRSFDRVEGGLGIGLALVKKLVELHGGAVAAESPGPGLGSNFTVRLPLAAGAPTSRPAG